jgi:hypothetical protein
VFISQLLVLVVSLTGLRFSRHFAISILTEHPVRSTPHWLRPLVKFQPYGGFAERLRSKIAGTVIQTIFQPD